MLTSVHRDRRGSAMTEFVIGLPVFILIFVGMGQIYRLNAEIIDLKGDVNRDLWAQTDPGEGRLFPITALGDIGGWEDALNNGGGVLGMYVDSAVKTTVPLLLPNTRPSSPCFTIECGQIGMDPSMFSKTLLEDNMLNGIMDGDLNADGWAGFMSSVLTATGTRASIAAGIRYGAVTADSQSRTVDFSTNSYSFESGDLQVPGITAPTHRALAVAITRVEFATDNVFNEQIPVFNTNWDFDSSSAEAGECTSAASDYDACYNSAPIDPDTGERDLSGCESPEDACEDLAGENPLSGVLSTYECPGGTPGC